MANNDLHQFFPTLILLVLLVVLVSPVQSQSADADRITNLPGLTFKPGFAQYSGYLPTTTGNLLHYWLLESQRSPTKDPLVLWLNGGPGCSSLLGLMTENGPFRVDEDGQTLFENIYSWNKGANVLYLESPRSVGYSYRNNSSPPDKIWNDDKTAKDNADALEQFFQRFPEYQNREFFITGESYVGVYGPTLTYELIKRIQKSNPHKINLVGLAIGNPILSEVDEVNSVIDMYYYYGMLGKEQFESLRTCCANFDGPLVYCNFSQYIDWTTWSTKKSTNVTEQMCAENVVIYSDGDPLNDPYSLYQDCYMNPLSPSSVRAMRKAKYRQRLQQLKNPTMQPVDSFIDQGSRINIGSTDAQYGSTCWLDEMTYNYLNLQTVRTALHIPKDLPRWSACNDTVFFSYKRQHLDMMSVFQSIVKLNYRLRILIYNGDVDAVCNFIGDEWFILRLGKQGKSKTARTPWTYQENKKYLPQLGGYQQRIVMNDYVTIDLLTVKGAGHMVPTDRGGPALQMITSFIDNTNYNSSIIYDVQPKTILPQYAPKPKIPLTRKQRDRVWYLPGLTFEPNFKQYAGYLNAAPGNYLFYWLVESQRDPANDPLVLWLNGGPGCSSLGGFFSENGPFRPNQDNATLFENNYAWNKMANVFFLESPRMVGFSWQNRSINPDEVYSDEKTTADAFLALMDFLTVFPEYVNRPFYITGESYAGIYIPTLTAYVIEKILAGKAPGLNLVGIAIGNGELSMIEQFNSIPTLLYYRGVYGYDRYMDLMNCCDNRNLSLPVAFCNFAQYVKFTPNGNATALKNDTCGRNLVAFAQAYIWDVQGIQDVYNLFEDGYRQYPSIYNIQGSAVQRKRLSSRLSRAFLPPSKLALDPSLYPDRRSKINYYSTDGKGNFYWYQQASLPAYLNQSDVRTALHVPPYVQEWSDCNLDMNSIYIQQHVEMGPVFNQILNFRYPLNILIYNGDVDTACDFLGDEWFIEKLAKNYSMPVTQQRIPWYYQSQTVGYWKEFRSPIGTLRFVTVKGAGHFVPTDRPGPALQMLNDFIEQVDMSTPIPVSTALSPLKPQYLIQQQISAALGTIGTRTKRSPEKLSRNAPGGMPGQTFQHTPESAPAFVPDGSGNKLFVWRFMADQSNAPVVVWLGDGPGCSVLYDIFGNIGLYRVSSQGTMLYKNPYAWDGVAHMVFLEAIPGAGFSVGKAETYNDTVAVNGIVNAVIWLYNHELSTYQKNEWYIFGRGYGSIYALLAAQKLLNGVDKTTIAIKGIGLGNSLLSYEKQLSVVPHLMYFSGVLGMDEYDELIQCCLDDKGNYQEPCPRLDYVKISDQGVVKPRSRAKCHQIVYKYIYQELLHRINPSGNMYRNCYEDMIPINGYSARRAKRQAPHFGPQPLTNNFTFINQEDLINYRSTDAFASYPCYMEYAMTKYLNRKDVQEALGVYSPSVWQICSSSLSYKKQLTHNMSSVFRDLVKKHKLRILMFDGDSHLQNNFLANELFVETLAKEMDLTVTANRYAWTYQEAEQWLPQYAGFVKQFQDSTSGTTIDLLTVKGAGYVIGLDRPATALRMFNNFLSGEEYNKTHAAPPMQQTLPKYEPPKPIQVSRKLADQIFELPGLTYKINFNQYSGYLKATKGNYLHYWFVESQNLANSDPLIIWFNGGPGCSSLDGLLTENGPFRPNPDGITLFENVFSWNKLANVLYIESPRQVGFSYQDKAVNPSTLFNDTSTLIDAYQAVLDFFTIFPEFTRNDLYISGESYAGIYVPMLTAHIIQQIQNGNADLNLKGMLVGNGYLSAIMDVRSLPDFLYFHGVYGKDIWDRLQQCCPENNKEMPTTTCTYDKYIEIDSHGEVREKPGENKTCANLVVQLAYDRVWRTMNDVYNLYQDCYQLTEEISLYNAEQEQRLHHHALHSAATSALRNSPAKLRVNIQKLQAEFGIAYPVKIPWTIYTQSTDPLGGFPCYMYHGMTKYLNQSHVRDALHIPTYVQPWHLCTDIDYTFMYNDTTPLFKQILDSNYPLRVLIYNGDVDMACTILEAEWFIEQFASDNNMAESPRGAWQYQLALQFATQLGGYKKRFSKNNLTIDLVTVKGAGHMVPADRAGPMLQLLTNFVRQQDYNEMSPFSYVRQPLLPQFTPEPEYNPTTPPAVRTSTTEYNPTTTSASGATPQSPTDSTTKKSKGASATAVSFLAVITVLFAIFNRE